MSKIHITYLKIILHTSENDSHYPPMVPYCICNYIVNNKESRAVFLSLTGLCEFNIKNIFIIMFFQGHILYTISSEH